MPLLIAAWITPLKAVAFKRNQIALCAVSLTVDNKTYSVAPEFSIG